jgi:hydroxymethylglutaryl-CoA reductase (NADPH)
VEDEVMLPLATYETPLWASVNRGAKVSMLAGGIKAVVADDRMTRSILLEAPDAEAAVCTTSALINRQPELASVVSSSSRFAQLLDIHAQCVANLMYVRFEMRTGDASGHNMVTKAADALIEWILKEYSDLKYVSVSGNFCSDKKATAVNGILGRGKNVITEINIPRDLCIKKNLIGTMLAGGIRSANAHYANMLLAFYLATGQDAANIVEGSQGFVHAEVRGDILYFSATVPNIIVGTIGSGKDQDFIRSNLAMMGCLKDREAGQNARRLAVICAAAVLCGELSLLAAQTNPGELMRAHVKMERKDAR